MWLMMLLQGTRDSKKEVFKPSMGRQTNPFFQENLSMKFSKNHSIKIDSSNTRNLKMISKVSVALNYTTMYYVCQQTFAASKRVFLASLTLLWTNTAKKSFFMTINFAMNVIHWFFHVTFWVSVISRDGKSKNLREIFSNVTHFHICFLWRTVS